MAGFTCFRLTALHLALPRGIQLVLSCICFSRLDSALGASLPHGLCVFHRSGLMQACLCGLPQALSIGLIGAPSGELPSDLTWGLSHGLTKFLSSQLHRRTCHKLDIRLAQRCTINSSRDYFDALTCTDSLHIDLSLQDSTCCRWSAGPVAHTPASCLLSEACSSCLSQWSYASHGSRWSRY